MQNQKKDYKYLYLKYKNKYINAKKLQVGSKVDIEKPLLIRQETKPINKINVTCFIICT